jgi:hypothetical protein
MGFTNNDIVAQLKEFLTIRITLFSNSDGLRLLR